MTLYLDTSVVVPLFIDEVGSARVASWLVEQGSVPLLSDLAAVEFQAVMSRLMRAGAIETERAAVLRELFSIWSGESTESVENLPVDIRSAARLVQVPQPRLLAADATHLATCQRLGLTLVTLDRDLQTICEREGVTWVAPS